MALLASLLAIAAALLPGLLLRHSVVSVGELLGAFAILAVVGAVFFAFVFQRVLRLKAEESREGSTPDMEIAEQS